MGLIEAEEASWGSGSKTHYRASAAGLSALKEWIGPPLPEWAASATFDPIRTRTYFLGALSLAARRRFLAEAGQVTKLELSRFRSSEPMQSADPCERLASLGVVSELEGRLRWLAIARKKVR